MLVRGRTEETVSNDVDDDWRSTATEAVTHLRPRCPGDARCPEDARSCRNAPRDGAYNRGVRPRVNPGVAWTKAL